MLYITIERKLYKLFLIISSTILFLTPLRTNGQTSTHNYLGLYYIKKIKYVNSRIALIEARLQSDKYLIITTSEIIQSRDMHEKKYYPLCLINVYPEYKLNDSISITNAADICYLQISDNLYIVNDKKLFTSERKNTDNYYIRPKKRYNYEIFKLSQ